MLPNFLVIGHVTWDVTQQGLRPGGAAYYAARTAQRLGRRAAVVTSCGPEWDPAVQLPGVEVEVVRAEGTTCFEHRYQRGQRRSWLRARAGEIPVEAVPPAWRACPVVLLAPVAAEVDVALARSFSGALLVVAPQGWLRAESDDRQAGPVTWDGSAVLPHVRACVFSLEDVGGDEGAIARYVAQVPLLVVTLGAEGARLWARGQWSVIPPYPAVERDPTGAGDVFAAAFLVGLARQQSPEAAAHLASAAAACSVEGEGASAVPGRFRLRFRLALGPQSGGR